jgi:cell division protein FtsW
MGLLFIFGLNIKFFIRLFILGILGLSGLIIVAPYRLKRITSFIDPFSDPLGTGFQAVQSFFAIGPGGLFGLGLFNSIQKQFYLPEPQTDFIFSIICEEFGIFGCLLVVSLFLFIIYRIIIISLKSNDLFAKYVSFGIVFQLSIQIILNLGVVTGLLPVTGVTLPFLSYGGSSLLITMISMGIVLNISKYN